MMVLNLVFWQIYESSLRCVEFYERGGNVKVERFLVLTLGKSAVFVQNCEMIEVALFKEGQDWDYLRLGKDLLLFLGLSLTVIEEQSSEKIFILTLIFVLALIQGRMII